MRRLLAAEEIAFVETNHFADRVPVVSWALDGKPVANPGNLLTFDLGAAALTAGNHKLTATVSNPSALTYGNLGTGGLSRAAFEQTLPDDHPSGGFVPGFGTHEVEHRAIDPSGNIGPAERYKATVLPGSSPACTRTLTGKQTTVVASTGVTCLTNAQVSRVVIVRSGASLVVRDSRISGALVSAGAQAVQTASRGSPGRTGRCWWATR